MSHALQYQEEQSEFVKFWNETLCEKFNKYQNILMDGLSYHSRVPLDQLELAAGSRVLDVGCGWGDTAIELAQKVGPNGRALGIDCVDNFLDHGKAEAKTRKVGNVDFIAADVQMYPFKPDYDLCFSRFGMMFFEYPVSAMRNIRKALKPGGRLLFITWRTIDDNPWFGVPKKLVLDFLPPPDDSAQTCGPGPFSMASQDMVTMQLQAAGFENIAFQRNDGTVMVGRDVEQAIQFQLALGPAGEIFREAGQLAIDREAEIKAALKRELLTYQTDVGIVMNSSSWAVSAYNPA